MTRKRYPLAPDDGSTSSPTSRTMNWRYFFYMITHPLKKRRYVEPDGNEWIITRKNIIEAFVDDSVAYGMSVALSNLWGTLTTPPTKR